MKKLPSIMTHSDRINRAGTLLLVGLAGVSLLIHCVILSGKKYMWADEIISYYSSSQQSFGSLISFVNDKISVGSPIYFVTVWFWAKLFTPSALSLRIFSSLGFCLALFMMWKLAYRVYGYWSAILSILTVFMFSDIIMGQNCEARFYGMLFAFTAILSYWTYMTVGERKFKIKIAFIQSVLHGMLPLIHPFGTIYSIIHVVAAFIIDIRNRYIRPWYYISALIGWVLYAPFVQGIIRQGELFKPAFWISVPKISELNKIYFGSTKMVYAMLMIILLVAATRVIYLKIPKHKANDFPLLVMAFLYLLVPLATWLESQWGMPSFMPRYVIIMNCGLIIFFSAVISRIFPLDSGPLLFKSIMAVVCFIIICMPIYMALHYPPLKNLPGPEEGKHTLGLPVVEYDTKDYLKKSLYLPNRNNYYYVLDWDVSILSGEPRDRPHDYQVMGTLKKYCPFLNIIQADEFLEKFPRFIVIEKTGWLRHRIMNNPEYRVAKIKSKIFLVEKVVGKEEVNVIANVSK